jgi:hypothetical protein
MGADTALKALGLRGNRSPLPRKEWPVCGARATDRASAVRVEQGKRSKRRCRFHGGLSTGPKTAAGRARIAEAQRRRWNAWRGGPPGQTPNAFLASERLARALWGISWMQA